jgi:hypothetical protein
MKEARSKTDKKVLNRSLYEGYNGVESALTVVKTAKGGGWSSLR